VECMNFGILQMTRRIVLADDQPLIRQYIKQLLSDREDLEVVAEADDGVSLLHLLIEGSVSPTLIIVDITMPRLGGIEAVRWIHAFYPEIKLLMLTMHKDPYYLAKAMAAGASGYLVKEDAGTELLPAINKILDGGTYISSCLSPEANSNS
jgi:DNA-binding NarL/FixJ family response regulator